MDEKIKTSIDLMVTMIIGELSVDLNEPEDVLFNKFVHSLTGKLLYDSDSKLWWSGPSDIAQIYKDEILNNKK